MNIKKVLLKYIVGILSRQDEETLQEWLAENPRHAVYFQKLQGRHNYSELYAQYRQTHPHLRVARIPFWKRSWVRAAVWLLPLALTAALWLVVNNHHTETIKPATSKALLFLDNGTTVRLGDATVAGWIHVDDHLMVANEEGTLRYEQQDVQQQNTEARNVLSTPRGGEYRIQLPDGTKVRLNAFSSLKYPTVFTGDMRVVELKGEAYFEIAKDSKRPFIVKTNGLEIKQYGTKFSVNARSAQATTVVLEEGSIGVSASGEAGEQLMQPGEVATWSESAGELSVLHSESTAEALTAWHRDRFVFDNETLGKVMETLSLWYDVDTRFQCAETASLHFTGNLSRYADISIILRAIENVANVRFKIHGREIMILQD